VKLWPRSRWRQAVLILLILAGAGAAALRQLLRSEWLAGQIRARIVEEASRATGAEVELKSFRFDWKRMTATVEELVLHGAEGAGEPPLVRVPKASVEIKIVSFLDRKVNVAGISLDGLTVNIRRDEQGRWNLPQPPGARSGASPVEPVIRLASERIRLRNATILYLDRKLPLDLEAHEVEVDLGFVRSERAYAGTFVSSRVRLQEPLAAPVEFGASTSIRFDEQGLDAPSSSVTFGQSRLAADVKLRNWESPELSLKARGMVLIADLHRPLRLPVERSGRIEFAVEGGLGPETPWHASGEAKLTGAGYSARGLRLAPVDAAAVLQVSEKGVTLEGLRATALGGQFTGRAEAAQNGRLLVDGEASGLPLERLYALQSPDALAWSGTIAGRIRVEGNLKGDLARNLVAQMDLTLTPPAEPADGRQPVSGRLAARYDGRGEDLRIEMAHLSLPNSRLNIQGDPNTRLEVGLISSSLDDFLPALRMATGDAAFAIPFRLQQGQLRIGGAWTGGLRAGGFTGRIAAGPLLAEGQRIDQIEADLAAGPARLALRHVRIRSGQAVVQGDGEVALAEWEATAQSPVKGSFELAQGRIEDLLALAGQGGLALTGRAAAAFRVEGTLGAPVIQGRASAADVQAWDEAIRSGEFEFRAAGRILDLQSGTLRAGGGTAGFSATFDAQGREWNDAEIRFQFDAKGFTLEQWNVLTQARKGIRGLLTAQAAGTLRLRDGMPESGSVQGALTAQNIVADNRPLGELEARVTTKDRLIALDASAIIGGAQIQGNAEWSLGASRLGLGQFTFRNVTLATLQDLGVLDPNQPPPARGIFEGELGFSGPIFEPSSWSANAKLTRAELRPSLRAGRRDEEIARFEVRNEGPVLGYLDRNGLRLTTARFVGEGTDLTVGGLIAFQARSPLNIQLNGKMNLPGLSVIEPDLLASGQAAVNVQVRGKFDEPLITGSMQLADAAFNLRGVPNGLEKVNGSVRFDRTRATIERLTAQSGGGDLSMGGFVGFGGSQLVYRLTAKAQRVRVRYPEAVSTTFDADLSLSGTSEQSLLAGALTVNRLGLNPQTDLGSILAETSKSAPPAPITNSFLRGMQLDVRVETSADAELQTSLTRDIQPEASLRLRGTAARPSVLGRVSVNEGQINFFGNEYRITRGEVGFFNPVKIDPLLNLDLETRVRGIIVTITLSGPPNKLNVSYRSDPPLQSNEIVALLTVGRAPASATSSAAPSFQGQSLFQSGGNSLLGAAVSAPLTSQVSGRLQRFFGVSRIKIDPELNTVTNTPQARLTIEQQLSREITVTYITNLNRTQNQIVRLQWDFSRDFSLLAVRDENGIFGIDFQYRKRFR
jgi:translocation and assembly module TamB